MAWRLRIGASFVETTKLHRLQENIASAEVELTEDDLREIEKGLPEAQGARYGEAHQRMIEAA